jgi:hypothetical protein
MIDLNPADIVAEARDVTGRFVLFFRTDIPPNFPLAWWAVCLDTTGDGHTALVRPTPLDAGDGWTAVELLQVAVARAQAEVGMRVRHEACALYLRAALRGYGPAARKHNVTFTTVPTGVTAVARGQELPFCSDPYGKTEGLTLDQIVLVLDRLHHDWVGAPGNARSAVRAAAGCCVLRRRGANR